MQIIPTRSQAEPAPSKPANAKPPDIASASVPDTLAAAVPVPVALWQITRTRAGDFQRPKRWESVTFWAVALLVGTAMAKLVGIPFLNF